MSWSQNTPIKSVVKALPIAKNGATDQITNDGDEYIPFKNDEQGERKISPTGELLGTRQFRLRVFTLENRGEMKFMLATECARVLGYRDSDYLFDKFPSLYKIIAARGEKDDLIHQDIVPFSYRSQQIAIVTARSMFRQFGARLIEGGRRVRDDYWEAEAINRGYTEEDIAEDEDPTSDKLTLDKLRDEARLSTRLSHTDDDLEREKKHRQTLWRQKNPMGKAKRIDVFELPEDHEDLDHHREEKREFSKDKKADIYQDYGGNIYQDDKRRIPLDPNNSLRALQAKLCYEDVGLYESNTDDIDSIRSQIFSVYSASSRGLKKASLFMDWDLPRFMRSQFIDDNEASLASVITLSGSVLYAQATTCSEYVRNTWPSQGARILRLFQHAFEAENHEAKGLPPNVYHKD